MKIPVDWLKEYVDLSGVSDAALSDALTMSGTENEMLCGADFPNIIVGEIKEITAHPNADKIRVTKTDVGKANGGVLQIVCGAPNIEVGQKVPVALVGAVIGEFEIKAAEIRGVKSFGMLCSEEELGISEDHTGIMILDPRAKVGQPLSDVLNIGGTVLEAEITPNRSDCFSLVGIAGEAAAALGKKTKNLKVTGPKITSKNLPAGQAGKVGVEITEPALCGRYIAKVVEGVKIGPSPKWMQDRLSAAGVRPISNIVDVTNYVMLEWGQPMHAFDYDQISETRDQRPGSSKHKSQSTKLIIVRKAKAGEKLVTLDGIERKLNATDLIIADSKKPIALAGVMGGLNSEVTAETKDVVLEAAVFDRTSVRKTAQRLALRSEASNRFEKGIPLSLPEIAMQRAAQLLTELGGGKAGENVDVQPIPIYPKYVGMRLTRLQKILGVEIPEEKATEILTSLGLEAGKFEPRTEARKHVGKPYIYGAKYSTHADMAFDCSYLTDYIYRKVGKFIGHTALAQFELGEPVEVADLVPGDILFIEGNNKKAVTDYYFVPAPTTTLGGPDGNGGHKKVMVDEPKLVGHCGIYIGGDRVIHARHDSGSKKNASKNPATGVVVEEDVTAFTENPGYLGARRFIADAPNWLSVKVPWWRLDINIEEDLFEEIGRIYGYDNIPATLPAGQLPRSTQNKGLALVTDIKEILSGVGYSEVANYSFVPSEWLARFGEDSARALRVANPLSPEQEYMRTTLGPSLTEDIRVNQDNFEDILIFEIASTYRPKKDLAKETQTLGIAVRTKGKKPEEAFFAIKGAIELIVEKLNLGKLSFKNSEKPFGGPEQTAAIFIENIEVGYLVMTNEKVTHQFDLHGPVAIAEINLASLVKFAGKVPEYKRVSRFPAVTRDVNLLFSSAVTAQKIETEMQKMKVPGYISVNILDIFEGSGLPENTKSVTIRMVFGSNEKTLTDADVLELQNKLVSHLKKSLSATERT